MGTAVSTDWTRADKLALALLVAFVCVSLPFLIHPWYDAVQDGSLYLSTARSIALGNGYTHLGSLFHLRPPGFSYLLAPIVAVFDYNFLALNLYISLWGAASLFLIFLYQREISGGIVSVCICTMLWLNPSFRELSNQLMSDMPGLAMLFGCLLVDRWASRNPSLRRDIVLGLAIGIATYVRSANLLLLPAIVTSRLWKASLRRGACGTRWISPG